jgi:pyruvate, orthophosphate dikinase
MFFGDERLDAINGKRQLLQQVERLHESNPMLDHLGCCLGIVYPEVTRMQVRAVIEAAARLQGEGL